MIKRFSILFLYSQGFRFMLFWNQFLRNATDGTWNIIDLIHAGVPCSTCNIKSQQTGRHWGPCEENPRVSPESRGDMSTSNDTSFDKWRDRSNKSTTGTLSGVFNGWKQKEKDSQGK